MTAEEALAQAERLDLGLVFTEHLDIGFPGDAEYVFDPEEYWKTYGSLRSDRLLLGVEIGMTAEHRRENRDFASCAPFDMVVGSLHVMEGMDLY